MILPVLVVTEVTQLIGSRLGPKAESAFLEELESGALAVEFINRDDWRRIADLVRLYQDFPLGTVDASVIAVAERLRATKIATLDRRHFTVIRPRHAAAFELLP